MKISQLSAHCGLSAHTLRFYAKNELIESKRAQRIWRQFDGTVSQTCRRVELVKTARDVGFSLDEIAQLLSSSLGPRSSPSCEEVAASTRYRLESTQRKNSAVGGDPAESATAAQKLRRRNGQCRALFDY